MEQKKHRFNIVDLIIIFVVATTVVLLVKNFLGDVKGEVQGEKINLQYVIETDIISEDLADNVSVGDTVYDYQSGKIIGTVTAYDVRNATHVGMSESGVQVISDIVGYRTLYITVESPAVGSPSGYSVESVSVSVGREYSIMLPELFCTGSCVSAEVID